MLGRLNGFFYVCEADSDCLWTVISFLVFVWVHKSLVFKLFIELIQSACICFVLLAMIDYMCLVLLDITVLLFVSVCREAQMELYAFGHWDSRDVSQHTEFMGKVYGHCVLMTTLLGSTQVVETNMLCGLI